MDKNPLPPSGIRLPRMFGGGGSARFSRWLRSENRDEPERILSSGFRTDAWRNGARGILKRCALRAVSEVGGDGAGEFSTFRRIRKPHDPMSFMQRCAGAAADLR